VLRTKAFHFAKKRFTGEAVLVVRNSLVLLRRMTHLIASRLIAWTKASLAPKSVSNVNQISPSFCVIFSKEKTTCDSFF
jgi:hypothetical protein